MGKKPPSRAVRTVVLAHSSPGALCHIGSPLTPRLQGASKSLAEPAMFSGGRLLRLSRRVLSTEAFGSRHHWAEGAMRDGPGSNVRIILLPKKSLSQLVGQRGGLLRRVTNLLTLSALAHQARQFIQFRFQLAAGTAVHLISYVPKNYVARRIPCGLTWSARRISSRL